MSRNLSIVTFCLLCTATKKSNFEELLIRDGFVSIHNQNLRFLVIEIFKVFKSINPQTVKEIFSLEM